MNSQLEEFAMNDTESAPPVSASEPFLSLDEQVLRYEGQLIKEALEKAEGGVTKAARLLGVTHQGLAFILNGRQKDLLPSRKPAKKRRRSIITKSQPSRKKRSEKDNTE
jgi:hypothetical protein